MFHLHPAFSFSHWYCMCAQIVLKTRVLYQTEKSMQRYAFFTRINCHSLSASFFGRRRRRRTVFLFWLELRLLLVRFFCVQVCVVVCAFFFWFNIFILYFVSCVCCVWAVWNSCEVPMCLHVDLFHSVVWIWCFFIVEPLKHVRNHYKFSEGIATIQFNTRKQNFLHTIKPTNRCILAMPFDLDADDYSDF